jgi:hypothetical protein
MRRQMIAAAQTLIPICAYILQVLTSLELLVFLELPSGH